jgi:ABC-type sugar transport system ATPase subunit
MATVDASGDPAEGTGPIIEMRGIEKRFGQVVALDGVDLTLEEGEVLSLAGDNGSGKSTLVKTLVGIHEADAGTISIRGEERDITSPKVAREHGISTVYQDLALVDTLSVATNMFLGRTPTKRLGVLRQVDWKQMNERAEEILRTRLNIDIDATKDVEYLSGGERQAVAIGRALVTDPDIVVMDEPMSALSADSRTRVRELIRSLNDEGITVLLISHSLDEVFSLTDRVTVLHSGHTVGTVHTASVSKDDIIQMMIGGEMPADHAD